MLLRPPGRAGEGEYRFSMATVKFCIQHGLIFLRPSSGEYKKHRNNKARNRNIKKSHVLRWRRNIKQSDASLQV